jgi:anthranilate synthase component 1
MYHPTLEEVKELKAQGNMVPVYRKLVADLETPVSAFLKINRGGYSFLLESVEGGERVARYSFIGTEPYKIISTYGKDNIDPLSVVSKEMEKLKVVNIDGLPRFCGGAVGYLSYEAVCRFEKLPSPETDNLDVPESFFMLADTLLVFDHATHYIKIMSYARLDEDDVETAYKKAVERIEELAKRLEQPLNLSIRKDAKNKSADTATGMTSNHTKEEFERSVLKIKDYITAGDAIQVVLSQRFSQPTEASPFDLYRSLRTINPSPYMFFFDFKDFQIIGASPEILVRAEDGNVMTRPLAGTRPRGKTAAEDAALEDELKKDEKECAEHIMLVDLGRNDIGRVSQPGTVKVSELMTVERYSHVMHLVTHVQGKLSKETNSFDALRACFPAGTVSGAPKIRAMEIIAELEPEKRGPYAGAAGYFSYSGNMDMAITIRTIVYKDKIAYVQSGCGIVYDSVPEKEYEETMNKARALLKAVTQAENSSGI